MHKMKQTVLILAIIIICITCDQVTKIIAEDLLSSSPPVSFLGNIFLLQLVSNEGAFLSFGSNWPPTIRLVLLTLLPILFLAFMFVFLLRSNHFDRLTMIAFAFILGGGISNMWDRALNDGFVLDFMNVGIGSLRTGIFNFADIFITTGFILIIYCSLRDFFQKRFTAK